MKNLIDSLKARKGWIEKQLMEIKEEIDLTQKRYDKQMSRLNNGIESELSTLQEINDAIVILEQSTGNTNGRNTIPIRKNGIS